MKCLKSNKTGEIIRVSNQKADQMVGSTWMFAPKVEWKAATRKQVAAPVEAVAEEQTQAQKQLKRRKNGK